MYIYMYTHAMIVHNSLQLGRVDITPVIGNLGEVDPTDLKINPAEVMELSSST